MAPPEKKTELPFILKITSPARRLLPYVASPERPVSFKEKSIWTFMALLIYLICCQIPLYGVIRNASKDPFYWFRTVIASNRFTLMELGITPIATSSMILQFLLNSKIINIDGKNKKHREALMSGQKLFAIVVIIFESYLLLRSETYGTLSELGTGNAVLIVLQLVTAGIVALLLDETLENGFGLGSGISLFIATNICENIFWKAFSPASIHTADGIQFEGAVVELLKSFFGNKRFYPEPARLWSIFARENLVSIRDLSATALLLVAAIYLEDIKIELPLGRKDARGKVGSIPIRLINSSNLPMLLQSALVSNVHFVSRILYNRYSHIFLVRFLGTWKVIKGYYRPVGGLAYYIFPVTSLSGIRKDPIHFVVYFFFVLAMCGTFSVSWLDISGGNPKSIGKQLDSEGLIFYGKRRRDTLRELKRNIYPSAVLGGFSIGILTVFSDLSGAVISGTSALMAANLIYNYRKAYIRRNE